MLAPSEHQRPGSAPATLLLALAAAVLGGTCNERPPGPFVVGLPLEARPNAPNLRFEGPDDVREFRIGLLNPGETTTYELRLHATAEGADTTLPFALGACEDDAYLDDHRELDALVSPPSDRHVEVAEIDRICDVEGHCATDLCVAFSGSDQPIRLQWWVLIDGERPHRVSFELEEITP